MWSEMGGDGRQFPFGIPALYAANRTPLAQEPACPRTVPGSTRQICTGEGGHPGRREHWCCMRERT